MPKLFHILENNPEVMTSLAQTLGMDSTLAFYDVYSLTEAELLAHIPRPVHALLVIIPLTKAWAAARDAEDQGKGEYKGKGAEEPVMWFKQTIGNACGSIGLVHCLLNSAASGHIRAGSTLEGIRQAGESRGMWERAKVLEESMAFEAAHEAAAKRGDTNVPEPLADEHTGQHFVAFVKGRDGHLWELEGARKGPLDRGPLAEDEDVLSAAAVERGLGRVIGLEGQGGDVRFSAIALAGVCRD